MKRFYGSFWITSVAAFILAATAMQSAATQVLTGHVPKAVAGSVSLGRLAAETNLDLQIGLPLRNPAGLKRLLDQIYDPGSSHYRHYLTPHKFTELFGPAKEDYQAVIQFAESHGLKVKATHSNRILLDVSGRAVDIEKALHVNLRLYQHPAEGRAYYAPDAEPSVELDVPLLTIGGLDNYMLPRPLLVERALPKVPPGGENRKGPPVSGQKNGTPYNGSGLAGTYLAKDLQAAYVPGLSLDGSGQVVGVFELDGFYTNDITAYETLAGLPAVTVSNVLVDGASGAPSSNSKQVAEVSLDIEMAQSLTPGLAAVIAYEGSSPVDILNAMAAADAANQLSSSWSWTVTPTIQQIFQQFAAQGQSFFEASGDLGAYTGPVTSPSDDPYITIVGGTTLSTSGPTGRWTGETTWNWFTTGAGMGATGGGVSTTFAIPIWQQGINMSANGGSIAMRNLPDVSMLADDLWVIYNNGQSGSFGGTSASAPLWASFMALVNQQSVALGQPPVGFVNPAVYAIGKGPAYSSCFHDITTGNNTNNTSTNFHAARGYDLCTGWGTPIASNLINALVQMPQYNVNILNGGFESGSFAYWTLVGDKTIGGGIANEVISSRSIQNGSQYIHSGTYSAFLGESNFLSTLSQSVATIPGQAYLLSFWFANPQGGTPNEFKVSWNGTVLFDQTDMGTFTWTNLQLVLPPGIGTNTTGTNSMLVFATRNDSAGFALDDVGIEAIPAPSFQTVSNANGSIAFKWNAQVGLAYQFQYATDLGLANWVNTGDAVTATNAVMSISVPAPSDAQGFYRLLLLP